MFKMLVCIGAGSAVGGVLRFLVSRWIQSAVDVAFPWGTLVVNVAGCFIIGLVYGLCDRHFCISPEMKAFLTVHHSGYESIPFGWLLRWVHHIFHFCQ